jgi:hypothetical protein
MSSRTVVEAGVVHRRPPSFAAFVAVVVVVVAVAEKIKSARLRSLQAV